MPNRRRYLPLTIRVIADCDLYVALCDELNVGSQGETVDEALANAREAIAVHLETLAGLGRRDGVLAERGLAPVSSPQARPISTTLAPDEIIESYFAPLDMEPVPA